MLRFAQVKVRCLSHAACSLLSTDQLCVTEVTFGCWTVRPALIRVAAFSICLTLSVSLLLKFEGLSFFPGASEDRSLADFLQLIVKGMATLRVTAHFPGDVLARAAVERPVVARSCGGNLNLTVIC